MKKLLLGSIICASALFAQSDYKYEITPMIGGAYTEGSTDLDQNYANFGLSIGANLDDSMFDQVELGFLQTAEEVDYEGNNGDTGITRIFTNLIKEYEISDKVAFYGLVGAGFEVFSDEKFDNESGLFGNYGLGYKHTLDNDMAIKFDVRHLIETDHGDNTVLYTLGLAIPFGKKGQAPAPVAMKPMDSDKDGVNDDMDKCPNTPMGAKVDADGCAVLVDLKINFDFDSAVIKPEFSKNIEGFANYLKDNKNAKATIEAHTDSTGSDAYNQTLSEKRAASAMEAIKAQDVTSDRLDSVGYGETKPVASNETAEGRAQNRRVQAVITRMK